jgi:hypothetical protein
MYRDLHRALQVLQYQFKKPGIDEQRYCLKAPSHLGNIELLMKVFPDAKVIFTHRDPFNAVYSLAMIRESLRGMYAAHVDPEAIGAETLQEAATALDLSLTARLKFPPGAFFELRFDDIVERPLERIKDIYDYVDEPLTSEAAAALAEADEKRDEHKSRAEKRDPALYGLTRDRVHGATRGYLAWARETLGGLT